MNENLYVKALGNEKKFVDLCNLQLIGTDYVAISNNKSKYEIDVFIMKNDRETIISTIEFEVVSERDESYNPIKSNKTPRFKDISCPVDKKKKMLNEENAWYVRVNKEFNETIKSTDSLINLGNTVLGYTIKATSMKKYPTEWRKILHPRNNFTALVLTEFVQCNPYDKNSKINTITKLIDFIYERLGIIKIQNTKDLTNWVLSQNLNKTTKRGEK